MPFRWLFREKQQLLGIAEPRGTFPRGFFFDQNKQLR